MVAAATVDEVSDRTRAPGLTTAQWRALARLCRWVERDEREGSPMAGPRAQAAVRALREAQTARRLRRHEGGSSDPRAAPTAVLAALADAAARWAACRLARPVSFYAPARGAIGLGLFLQLPQLKAWLQQGFPLEAAVSPDAPPEACAARAREVLIQHCLSLCDSGDGFHRRRHLLQLLSEHGYRQPLLRLVRRAAEDWAPRGWAESWELLSGIDVEERVLAELDRAGAAAVPALQTWSRQPTKPKAVTSAASSAALPAPPGGPVQATDRIPQMPAILRAWQLPRRVRLWAAGTATLAVGMGLALHLWPGGGPAAARWVSFYTSEDATLSIDPDSIRREGRQLTYRVAVVRRGENSSALAVFSADCRTRQRRIETVQHYRGTRFETATRYEVRDAASSPWPPTGADVRLLQAACDAR